MKHNLIGWIILAVFHSIVWVLGAPPKDEK
jgi:hypothetical protein